MKASRKYKSERLGRMQWKDLANVSQKYYEECNENI